MDNIPQSPLHHRQHWFCAVFLECLVVHTVSGFTIRRFSQIHICFPRSPMWIVTLDSVLWSQVWPTARFEKFKFIVGSWSKLDTCRIASVRKERHLRRACLSVSWRLSWCSRSSTATARSESSTYPQTVSDCTRHVHYSHGNVLSWQTRQR